MKFYNISQKLIYIELKKKLITFFFFFRLSIMPEVFKVIELTLTLKRYCSILTEFRIVREEVTFCLKRPKS